MAAAPVTTLEKPAPSRGNVGALGPHRAPVQGPQEGTTRFKLRPHPVAAKRDALRHEARRSRVLAYGTSLQTLDHQATTYDDDDDNKDEERLSCCAGAFCPGECLGY